MQYKNSVINFINSNTINITQFYRSRYVDDCQIRHTWNLEFNTGASLIIEFDGDVNNLLTPILAVVNSRDYTVNNFRGQEYFKFTDVNIFYGWFINIKHAYQK